MKSRYVGTRLLVCVAVLPIGLAACASDTGARTINVPADKATISEAVRAARPGDLVLVAEGTYEESVTVETDNITIRGVDRNAVVLDGGYRRINGIEVYADGVAVENLTITGYVQNGLIFDGGYEREARSTPGQGADTLVGYRASYVTAYNNGLYGIYAFAARDGIIEHSYVSGHPDSGIYVGQCRPCNALVTGNKVENNAIGYYGTNASGNVNVVGNEFVGNRLGVAPNSQKAELLAPQEETVVAGNWIHDNDNPNAPEIPRGYFGGGIAVGAGTKNTVTKNLVEGHDGVGIEVSPLNDLVPSNNVVRGNVLRDNRFDLVYVSADGKPNGNCFAGNTFKTSSPIGIEKVMGCPAGAGTVKAGTYTAVKAPPGPSYRDVPAPPKQENMPGVRTTPRTAVVAPATRDWAADAVVPGGK